jgi:hypothetical protein
MNAGRVVIVPWISASDSGSSMYFCKRPAQGTRSVAAVGECLVEDPLLRLVRHGHGDRLLRQVLVQWLTMSSRIWIRSARSAP